eukprot:gb/GECG01013643.1/.p1 GENE.gb/GECG01013643.1/~~gb/GECG01013643.1/.p1  ORF type:complete len:242 (+),score=12.84 gb/GECG01013643.1/:1-726(+)
MSKLKQYWQGFWAQQAHLQSFHLAKPNPNLVRYLPQLGEFHTVVLPSCGITQDLLWLAQRPTTPLRVTGIDIVEEVGPKWLEQHEFSLEHQHVEFETLNSQFPVYRVHTQPEACAEVIIGDFLDENFISYTFGSQNDKVDVVWDRAGMTSMQDMNEVEVYLRHCYDILKPSGKLLIEFMHSDYQPQGVNVSLGKAMYLFKKVGFTQPQVLHSNDVMADYPNVTLGQHGMTQLTEIVVLMSK